MAEIAQEAGVSPPTVFNYFGSKENILSALIFEGTEHERTAHLKMPRKTNRPFADVLGDLFSEFSVNTLRIAGKRVWRYAEAANIRRPNSDFEKKFRHSDAELARLVFAVMGDYDMVLRNGETPDPEFLGSLFFDRWTALYFSFIKDDNMPMETHEAEIRRDVGNMVALLFDETFAESSPLKAERAAV